MTIGIMGAMIEEIDSIYKHMSDVSTMEYGGRQYHLGKIDNQKVVLVFSRWGKVAAATTVTTLITHFKIEQLIFSGVAGATSNHLNIGDIVISDQLYQHDIDARPLMPRHQIPLTNITFLKADPLLVNKAHAATDGLFSSLSEKISAEILSHFNITQPKCILGTIATGDQFISSQKLTSAIVAEKPETMAVEMEGAAVAQVCHDYGIPFVIIRIISDKADHSAEIDFPRFVDQVAKHYSEHIVKGICSIL